MPKASRNQGRYTVGAELDLVLSRQHEVAEVGLAGGDQDIDEIMDVGRIDRVEKINARERIHHDNNYHLRE